MSRYYAGRQARHSNTRLREFSERTHTVALSFTDFETLRRVGEQEGRAPRVLDVACGTGLFLKQILERGHAERGARADQDDSLKLFMHLASGIAQIGKRTGDDAQPMALSAVCGVEQLSTVNGLR